MKASQYNISAECPITGKSKTYAFFCSEGHIKATISASKILGANLSELLSMANSRYATAQRIKNKRRHERAAKIAWGEEPL